MKSTLAFTGLILSVCAMSFAQDTAGDRIVVPASNSTHRRVVNCNLLSGSITVKTHSGKEVLVEGDGGNLAKSKPWKDTSDSNVPSGMHRIGVATRGLDVVEEDNVITIHRPNGSGSVLITVPVDTSLRLHTLSGAIHVDGVHGEVEVHTLNGHVELANISGTVSADSQNGPIKVGMDAVDASKPLALSSFNGVVDLTLPSDLKANLTVKTDRGEVYSDFEVTLGGTRTLTGKSTGQYRIRTDNTIHGTINGGGVDLTIHTFNGAVYIHKKK